MKKLSLLLSIMFCCCLYAATAQTSNTTTTRTFKIDESTIVKDVEGKVYPFAAWTKMIRSGAYTLQPENMNAAAPSFVLVKKADAQTQMPAATGERSAAMLMPAPVRRAPMQYVPPGESSVVKDSANLVYPYAAWHNMMATGNYRMKLMYAGPDSGVYFMNKLSMQEKDAIAGKMTKPEASDRFKIGDDFGVFRARDINGEKFDSKALAGKVIVLNFWFIGCPPCRAEIPDLNEVAAYYKDNKEVVFMAVCLDEAFDIKQYTKLHPFNYHIIDNGGYIAQKYGVHLYPTNVVIDKNRKVVFSSVSSQYTNPYWIRKSVDAALAAPITTTAAK